MRMCACVRACVCTRHGNQRPRVLPAFLPAARLFDRNFFVASLPTLSIILSSYFEPFLSVSVCLSVCLPACLSLPRSPRPPPFLPSVPVPVPVCPLSATNLFSDANDCLLSTFNVLHGESIQASLRVSAREKLAILIHSESFHSTGLIRCSFPETIIVRTNAAQRCLNRRGQHCWRYSMHMNWLL
jgi:hypothetical protein